MESRLAVLAGRYRQALTVALVLASGTAGATPKNRSARMTFDRAVKAYAGGKFKQASDLFARSYKQESDPDALFGWAQAERKLGHCDKAVELYERLLASNMPAENKQAVHEPMEECKTALETARPKPETKPVPEVKPEPRPEPPPPAAPPPETPPEAKPSGPPPTTTVRVEGRSWWKDPVGDAFVGLGVVGLGVGTALWISSHNAESDAAAANNYFDAKALAVRAKDRGEQGTVAVAAGGGLVVLGILWYAMHRESDHVVSGWVAPTSGGLGVAGVF